MKLLYNSEKILKECCWSLRAGNTLFIFNNTIFENKTQESQIIWAELMNNVITHINGITKFSLAWTIKHRFWLNSEWITQLLGIKIFNKSQKAEAATFSNCTFSDVELNFEEHEAKRKIQLELKKEKSILYEELPGPAETVKATFKLAPKVLDSLTHVLCTTKEEINPFLTLAVKKFKSKTEHFP